MTREELTARLRKLTGKTSTDIEALDERVDALEAASGGGVEFNTLDVTVTFTGSNHTFTGFISSEIPETTVITDIIKIDRVDVQGSGEQAITNIVPLPTLTGRTDLSNNFTLKGYETFSKMDPVPSGITIPLGIVFVKMDFDTELTEITETFKITYV